MTESQRAVYQSVEDLSSYFFQGLWKRDTIKPRTSLLIAGPSGVGKSHVVSSFARTHGLGYLRLTIGDWLPAGSRGDRHTLDIVEEFLSDGGRYVIFIDELDKIDRAFRSEWSSYVLNELYSLLDRTCFDGGITSQRRSQASKRLHENVYFVGAGTWQDLWEVRGGKTRPMGFQQTGVGDMACNIFDARIIPTELMNRFSPELALIQPMTAKDFSTALECDHIGERAKKLGIHADPDAGVSSGLQMRWLESIALRVALAEHATSASLRVPTV